MLLSKGLLCRPVCLIQRFDSIQRFPALQAQCIGNTTPFLSTEDQDTVKNLIRNHTFSTHQGWTCASTIWSRIIQSDSAASDRPQLDLGDNGTLQSEQHQHGVQDKAPSPVDSDLRLEKRLSKFETSEREKEDRLLINRLLKDKGQLSYDWRIPVRLLEGHYARSGSPEFSRDFVSHQGPFRLRLVRSRSPREGWQHWTISKPAFWSVATVVGYVQDIAESPECLKELPQMLPSQPDAPSSSASAGSAMDAVFSLPATRKHLSTAAYNIGLRFYSNRGNLSKLRALFTQMEESEIKTTTETFNILLEGAASAKDLHSFTFILIRSLQRGFRPDIESWNMLLMAIDSNEVRGAIIQRMRERGFLESLPTKKGISKFVIYNNIAQDVATYGNGAAFLDYMDTRYGTSWLTTSTGNKLLYEYNKRKTLPATLELLPGMKLRGFSPDQISLDTLLRQFLRMRQAKEVVETLRCFDFHFGLKLERMMYETIFLLAWRMRLLNFARVIWRFSCVHGLTTHRMRIMVFRSLLADEPTSSSDSTSVRFTKLFGLFICGVNKSNANKSAGLEQDISPSECGYRKSMVAVARTRLRNDLKVAKSSEVRQDLVGLLDQALRSDLGWASEKFIKTATLGQILQNGIHFELEKSYVSKTCSPISRVPAVRVYKYTLRRRFRKYTAAARRNVLIHVVKPIHPLGAASLPQAYSARRVPRARKNLRIMSHRNRSSRHTGRRNKALDERNYPSRLHRRRTAAGRTSQQSSSDPSKGRSSTTAIPNTRSPMNTIDVTATGEPRSIIPRKVKLFVPRKVRSFNAKPSAPARDQLWDLTTTRDTMANKTRIPMSHPASVSHPPLPEYPASADHHHIVTTLQDSMKSGPPHPMRRTKSTPIMTNQKDTRSLVRRTSKKPKQRTPATLPKSKQKRPHHPLVRYQLFTKPETMRRIFSITPTAPTPPNPKISTKDNYKSPDRATVRKYIGYSHPTHEKRLSKVRGAPQAVKIHMGSVTEERTLETERIPHAPRRRTSTKEKRNLLKEQRKRSFRPFKRRPFVIPMRTMDSTGLVRKHQIGLVRIRHVVPPPRKLRKPSKIPEKMNLETKLETARLHSSLDQLLDLEAMVG